MNVSTASARAIALACVRQGMRHIVICPGSRSAPLTYAFAELDRQGLATAHVRIDERDGAFLALGIARGLRAAGQPGPVGVVTTSGSAVANLHPAILEAAYSHVPVVALTADRPARLRATGANQTLDDQSVVLSDVLTRCDIPAEVPAAQAANTAVEMVQAAIGQAPTGGTLPGPVQLNVQFDVPLVPEPEDFPWQPELAVEPQPNHTAAPALRSQQLAALSSLSADKLATTVFVAGDDAGFGDRTALEELVTALDVPVLAEPSSPLYRRSVLCADEVLAHSTALSAAITDVIVYGKVTLFRPTAKLLARDDVRIHRIELDTDLPVLTQRAAALRAQAGNTSAAGSWRANWEQAGAHTFNLQTPNALAAAAASIASAPGHVFIASSNAVRYLARGLAHPDSVVHASRGLAGIDGLISTAAGLSIGLGETVRLVIGDVAALHDVGGLLREKQEVLPGLQIFILNDDGGSIFGGLEHSGEHLAPYFERFFQTAHGRSFDHLATAYGWPYRHIRNEDELLLTVNSGQPGVFEIRV